MYYYENSESFNTLSLLYSVTIQKLLFGFVNACYPYGRDAVALLLHNKEAMVDEKNVGSSTPWLIDLRRHDERVLYGHIKGSMHIRGRNTSPLGLCEFPAFNECP